MYVCMYDIVCMALYAAYIHIIDCLLASLSQLIHSWPPIAFNTEKSSKPPKLFACS